VWLAERVEKSFNCRREKRMRLFFATDIHGSETCWRKFLNSGKHYGADVLVLGGDMTGKALVPMSSASSRTTSRAGTSSSTTRC